jgi:hypothetical protein
MNNASEKIDCRDVGKVYIDVYFRNYYAGNTLFGEDLRGRRNLFPLPLRGDYEEGSFVRYD